MNSNRLQGALVVLLTLALAMSSGGVAPAAAQAGVPPAAPAETQANVANSFTYQGQLDSGGTPVTGTCDMELKLFNALAGPAQVGGTQTINAVSLVAGKFTVALNFGTTTAFDGQARWLEIAVRCPAGSGGFTTLAPRQPLTAAPYALSLRPGALVQGSSLSTNGAGLKVVNSYTPEQGIWAVLGAESGHLSSAASAVRGDSLGNIGVVGVSDADYGVYGFSQNFHGVVGDTDDDSGASAGVYALGAGNVNQSIALGISSGGIKVNHAGVNTDTPLFIHKVATGGGGNVCTGGAWASTIDYELINGNPDAILLLTPNNGPYSGGTTPLNSIPAVFYDNTNFCGHGAGKWVVYNLALAALPNNAMYNVLVVVP